MQQHRRYAPQVMERFRIVDHGCKVNRYDGELLRSELRRLGLSETESDSGADLMVLNACAVTDRAVKKGRQALRRMRRSRPGAQMLVTGCMTAGDHAGYRRIDSDLIALSSGEQQTIRETLQELLGHAVTAGPAGLDGAAFDDRTRAFLKIQDGCDARCAYCVIPSIRGGARSRARPEVLAEARRLIDQGFRELVLCGVHLGHFGRDTGESLSDLVSDLAGLEGEFRIRLSSLEIMEVDRPLARTVAQDPRVVPHLHLPLQSGSSEVLRRMRRPYTARRFLSKIEELRAACPDLAVTSDVIVGFPGETEADFQSTLRTVRSALLSRIHIFPFSPRVGTEAASLPNRVEAPVVRTRIARLAREARRLLEQSDRALIGRLATVLVERSGSEESSGLCEWYRRIRLPGSHPPSTFIRCHIVERIDGDLLGEPCP